MTDQEPAPEPRVSQLDRVKQEYTQAAREILQRSMRGVAKTKLTPDMLTLAGVSLCLAGAVLVGFEDRNEKLFFWLGGFLFVVGSVADILDGALASAASKGTVFGAFLDSTSTGSARPPCLLPSGSSSCATGTRSRSSPRSPP